MGKFKDITTEFKINPMTMLGVKVRINTGVYNERIPKAQYYLDDAISNSMLPYIPMQTSALKQAIVMENASIAGSGKVCIYTTPYGRYQYYGVKMVDSVTGKGPRKIELGDGSIIFRYKHGATLVPTNEPLHYQNPEATPRWFETAKSNFSKEWIDGVKRILING